MPRLAMKGRPQALLPASGRCAGDRKQSSAINGWMSALHPLRISVPIGPGAAAPHGRLAVNPPVARRRMLDDPSSPARAQLEQRPARQSGRRCSGRGRRGVVAQQGEGAPIWLRAAPAFQVSNMVIDRPRLLAARLIPFRRKRIAIVENRTGRDIGPDRTIKVAGQRLDRRH